MHENGDWEGAANVFDGATSGYEINDNNDITTTTTKRRNLGTGGDHLGDDMGR